MRHLNALWIAKWNASEPRWRLPAVNAKSQFDFGCVTLWLFFASHSSSLPSLAILSFKRLRLVSRLDGCTLCLVSHLTNIPLHCALRRLFLLFCCLFGAFRELLMLGSLSDLARNTCDCGGVFAANPRRPDLEMRAYDTLLKRRLLIIVHNEFS